MSPRKLYQLNETTKLTGIGKTKLYEEMAAGRLRYIQYGARRLIPEDAIDEFIANLERQAAA